MTSGVRLRSTQTVLPPGGGGKAQGAPQFLKMQKQRGGRALFQGVRKWSQDEWSRPLDVVEAPTVQEQPKPRPFGSATWTPMSETSQMRTKLIQNDQERGQQSGPLPQAGGPRLGGASDSQTGHPCA